LSHHLNRPEAKRLCAKLANLKIPEMDLIEVFIDLLEAENLKSKNLANERGLYASSCRRCCVLPGAQTARIKELDRTASQQHRTWLINAACAKAYSRGLSGSMAEGCSKLVREADTA
jgi:hypothetical protein